MQRHALASPPPLKCVPHLLQAGKLGKALQCCHPALTPTVVAPRTVEIVLVCVYFMVANANLQTKA